MHVRIPIYQQQTTPDLVGQPRAQAGVLSDAVGRELSRAGAIGTALVERDQAEQERQRRIAEAEAKRQEQEDAKVWTAEAMSRVRIHADERFRDLQSKAEPGAPDFSRTVTDEFDKYAQETLKNAPAAARPMMQVSIANVRDNVAISARNYEYQARADWRTRQMASGIDNTARLVFNDPAQFRTTYAEQSAVIQALDIPPTVKDNLQETARKTIANAAVSGWIIQNPQAAYTILKEQATDPTQGGKHFETRLDGRKTTMVPWGNLTVGEQQHWLRYAETLSKQTDSVEKRRASNLIRDAEAAADSGITTAIPESVFAVFGPEAADVRAQYERSQVMARNIAQVSTLPVNERLALVEQVTPKTGGEGFAEAEKRAQDVARAVNEANRRQADDPAAYAIQVAPQTVGAAYAGLQNALASPTMPADQKRVAAQAYADAVVAEQERLGSISTSKRLKGQIDSPILPKPLAQSIAKQFMTPREGGQGPAQLLQSQADLWGNYWPAVYRQIAQDIGPTARVVANLRDTPAAAMLSMNAALKTEDLKKPVGTANVTTINETIASELTEFRESLVGWTTGGSQAFNDYDEAARRNAYVYAAQGMKPAEAAKRAARELVLDYYDFSGTVRIPKLPNVDPRGAQAGMDAVLRSADKMKLRVPLEEARILGPDFTADQLAKSVRTNGFFVTLGDDSGVGLYLKGNNGERAVEGADGRPITYTWRELMDLAAASKPAPRVPLFNQTPGGAATGRAR